MNEVHTLGQCGLHFLILQDHLCTLDTFFSSYFKALLRDIDTVSRETTVKIYFAVFVTEVRYEWKEFTLVWSRFFPFIVDSFTEGYWSAE